MTNEEKYVAAAYLVVFAFVLVYLVIMALKLSRLDREIGELTELARKKAQPGEGHGGTGRGFPRSRGRGFAAAPREDVQ
jgi:CcmD family protein